MGEAARKITELEPGIYYDIPASDYHALPYISSTFLKKFRDNPASALIETEVTEDMLVGQAVHSFSLEGLDAFNREFVVMFSSDLNKNTNEYKRQKGEFELANMGKTILPALYKKVPMMEVLKGVDASLREHPVTGLFLKQGMQEVTLIWDDEETGLRCKARLDWSPGKRMLVDLKKCADVAKFRNQIVSMNYDVQGGWYTYGAIACGMDPDTFVFAAVEAEPPYAVKCGYLSPEWLAWAQDEAKRLLRLVAECRHLNRFPNYEIPPHICSLEQMCSHDLLEEFVMPAWR